MDVRKSLGSDHQAIERKLQQLSDAVEGADFPTILDVFRQVDRGLRAHVDGEERYLFERFETGHPDDIEALRSEHARFRRALDDLMIQTELHTLRKESIDDLIAQLRRHAAKENQTLYAWADEHPVESEQNGLFTFLEERRVSLREEST